MVIMVLIMQISHGITRRPYDFNHELVISQQVPYGEERGLALFGELYIPSSLSLGTSFFLLSIYRIVSL